MGRRPKPTALHKLQGTYNVTDHGRARKYEPVAIGELAEPPPDLTDSQQEEWRYAVLHMPKGVVKLIDRNIFRVWVEASDRHNVARTMQAMLDRDTKLKLLIKTADGLGPSPYNDIMDKCAKTMFRAAQELGFSPSARPRIHADMPAADAMKSDPQTDPWKFLEVIPGGKR